MSFVGQRLNDLFKHLSGGKSPYDYLANFEAKLIARQMSRSAARAALCQAEVTNKAKHITAMESIVEQARFANAHAEMSQNIQLVIAALLLLNFFALLGLIIVSTPALSEQRDRYVTPVVRGLIRSGEKVADAHARVALRVKEDVLLIVHAFEYLYGIAKARVVTALNGEDSIVVEKVVVEKVVAKKQGGMVPPVPLGRIPPTNGRLYVAPQEHHADPATYIAACKLRCQDNVRAMNLSGSNGDCNVFPPLNHNVDHSSGVESASERKFEPEALNDYTPSESDDGILNGQDYIDEAENDFDAEWNVEEAEVALDTAEGDHEENLESSRAEDMLQGW